MRILTEKLRSSEHMARLMTDRWGEVAYATLGLSGPALMIEFPSDWHETRAGWVRIGLGFGKIAFSFPWPWVVPDDYQCSGPRYGFSFFDDVLFFHWGKDHGTRDDPSKAFDMPWSWKHRLHEILSKPEAYPYRYKLKSGEVQDRIATVNVERRTWTRFWLPYKKVSTSINVDFDDEVGERTGSWKGGTLGCGYEMLEGETALQCLRRMEQERKF